MYNLLYCEYCSYKNISRDENDILIKKISKEKYRCPECGRLIKLRKYKKDPQKELDHEKKLEKDKEKIKKYYESIIEYKKEFEENRDE